MRTLSARENSFEYDCDVLFSELRQNKIAETNERTLVMRSSYEVKLGINFGREFSDLFLTSSDQSKLAPFRRSKKVSGFTGKSQDFHRKIFRYLLFFL